MKKFLKSIPGYGWLATIGWLVLNCSVYFGTRLLPHDAVYHAVALPLDSRIPLVPVMIVPYVLSYPFWGLNYLLILRIGMAGAAVATLISHSLQLTLHYLYVRFALGGKEYPFPLKMWVGYAAVFAAVAVASVAADGLWLARWGLGAAVGLWELLRIRKRKVLI